MRNERCWNEFKGWEGLQEETHAWFDRDIAHAGTPPVTIEVFYDRDEDEIYYHVVSGNTYHEYDDPAVICLGYVDHWLGDASDYYDEKGTKIMSSDDFIMPETALEWCENAYSIYSEQEENEE